LALGNPGCATSRRGLAGTRSSENGRLCMVRPMPHGTRRSPLMYCPSSWKGRVGRPGFFEVLVVFMPAFYFFSRLKRQGNKGRILRRKCGFEQKTYWSQRDTNRTRNLVFERISRSVGQNDGAHRSVAIRCQPPRQLSDLSGLGSPAITDVRLCRKGVSTAKILLSLLRESRENTPIA
jgi:hypothetical protein